MAYIAIDLSIASRASIAIVLQLSDCLMSYRNRLTTSIVAWLIAIVVLVNYLSIIACNRVLVYKKRLQACRDPLTICPVWMTELVRNFLPSRGRLKGGNKEVYSELITTERRFNVCLPVFTLFALFLHCKR